MTVYEYEKMKEEYRAKESEPRPPAFSDDALALEFTRRHTADMKYVAIWGSWMVWTGTVWRRDQTLAAFDAIRSTCRDVATNCNKPPIASAISSAKTVAAVERLARADRRHAEETDSWDSDPFVLNTPAGIIDLRTGGLGPSDPAARCAMSTAVGPDGDCPQWRGFLDRITGADQELQDYLQRVAGYALTGSTSEHALFFGYGTGANGKSVFTSTLSGILGGYCVTSPIETFTASSTDRHPTDLAMLRGARLVVAQETEEGRRWAEAKVKAVTGGDRITARFMRQDFFTFQPAFKLLVAGNHRPGLQSVDEAIRRRFNVIPFAVTIPATERDPSLTDKLRGEWPGILAWAIDGCLEWQRIGLQPPQIVQLATDEYLVAEDAIATWLSECCQVRAGYEASSADLFASWKAWAERSGEPAISQQRLIQKLVSRGFVRIEIGHRKKRGLSGIQVIQWDTSDAYWNR